MRPRTSEKRLNLHLQETPQFVAGLFIHLHARGNRDVPVRTGPRRHGSLIFGGAGNIPFQCGAGFIDQPGGFFSKLATHAIDLFVDGFHRQLRGVTRA